MHIHTLISLALCLTRSSGLTRLCVIRCQLSARLTARIIIFRKYHELLLIARAATREGYAIYEYWIGRKIYGFSKEYLNYFLFKLYQLYKHREIYL